MSEISSAETPLVVGGVFIIRIENNAHPILNYFVLYVCCSSYMDTL